ncbi:hypothetical protein RHAL1_02876 [Beijerinckiaceae bacterium RH AL1]|nr:ClpXP protease specificity-enhancing factor SspB [Beijerinckiaceae bacterium]VVB47563.1 hypothetical protein RHCH11_RHCH11_02815 [Beijerinckiaceae bacterium RH CH11]VVB47644.1 hypothetical protein RHAL8_02811 [Beijerinckiaceae bacterium RH AL8]VVC55952.1 hypothetical protein RHAL1_02876 [Beijerinckiaceae bacterium RH AL1]
MPNDLIRYDLLVQEALCGVVKKVLGDVARNGELPGDHHFYITFRTHAPGVRLSSRMREQYPEEMTIILQHQYEGLRVSDHAFEVGLSFKSIPEVLVVPFDALTGFFDPSVPFNFKFEPQPNVDAEEVGEPGAPAPRALTSVPPAPASGGLVAMPKAAPEKSAVDKADGKAKPKAVPAKAVPASAEADADSDAPADAAKVVSIDAFRKKP